MKEWELAETLVLLVAFSCVKCFSENVALLIVLVETKVADEISNGN